MTVKSVQWCTHWVGRENRSVSKCVDNDDIGAFIWLRVPPLTIERGQVQGTISGEFIQHFSRNRYEMISAPKTVCQTCDGRGNLLSAVCYFARCVCPGNRRSVSKSISGVAHKPKTVNWRQKYFVSSFFCARFSGKSQNDRLADPSTSTVLDPLLVAVVITSNGGYWAVTKSFPVFYWINKFTSQIDIIDFKLGVKTYHSNFLPSMASSSSTGTITISQFHNFQAINFHQFLWRHSMWMSLSNDEFLIKILRLEGFHCFIGCAKAHPNRHTHTHTHIHRYTHGSTCTRALHARYDVANRPFCTFNARAN